MGCCFSGKRLSSASEEPSTTIRVVHSNGYVEYLEQPVTVAQVIGKPPKHLLFTHAQLLAHATTPLKVDAVLEGGRVYFMLPCSLFKANLSPDDLAPMIRKLTAVAQNSKLKCKRDEKQTSSSASSSPNRIPSPDRQNGICFNVDNCQVLIEMHKAARLKPWKPILSTIREISFNRRSESDLPEFVKVDRIVA